MTRTAAVLMQGYLLKQGALSASTSASWPCYIAQMPDGDGVVDECACLYDLPGRPDGRSMRGQVFERYDCQLKVRAKDYQNAFARIEACKAIFDAAVCLGLDTAESFFFVPVITRGQPISMGPEPSSTKRRFLFSLNFSLVAQEYEKSSPSDVGYQDLFKTISSLVSIQLPALATT